MERCVSRHCENTLSQTPPELSNISALLFSNSGLVPLAKRPYELRHPDGTVLTGTTDPDGYLEHRDVPVGDYALEVDGIAGSVPTVRDPKERLPLRVRGYYLIHRLESSQTPTKPAPAPTPEMEPSLEEWELLEPIPEEDAEEDSETEE